MGTNITNFAGFAGGFVGFFFFLSSQAYAEPDWGNVSVTDDGATAPGFLRAEVFSIRSALGAVDYRSTRRGDHSRLQRILGGLSLNANAMSWFDSDAPQYYLGVASGVFYSHLGGGAEADLFLVPANLKFGQHFGDIFRFSIHGGGTLTYRSAAGAVQFHPDDRSQKDSLWKMYPNAGFEAEFGLGNGVLFSVRPDWIFGHGDTVFVGLLGIGLMT